MKKCPVCEKGNLKEGKVEEEMFGTSLGRYRAEICDRCGESFVDEETMRAIEQKARQLGIWGLAKKIKIVRSGNSLAIRIPADIARFLKLEEGKEMFLHPEGTTKLAIEII
ncbi:MAG: YgiT-type zinc finger protein [Methanocellales archaeon]|nr:YgiT-type zinc finger protein [Methanocellales archaeon]MDI6859173.1 YgiT-type zinc finger protein [Methanocellales archaeon]MDI6902407.1 YgiT-type zinc finger protein [Methanocellales archaeon]